MDQTSLTPPEAGSTPANSTPTEQAAAPIQAPRKKPNWTFITITILAILAGAILGGFGVYYTLGQNQTNKTDNHDGMTMTPTPTAMVMPTATPTPSPTPTEQANVVSKDYPVLKSQAISPNGKYKLSLRSKTQDGPQVLIQSDINNLGERILTRDPEDGKIEEITGKNWRHDSKYAYITLSHIDAFSFWLLRLDGGVFKTSATKVLKDSETASRPGHFFGSIDASWQGETLVSNAFTWDPATEVLTVAATGN